MSSDVLGGFLTSHGNLCATSEITFPALIERLVTGEHRMFGLGVENPSQVDDSVAFTPGGERAVVFIKRLKAASHWAGRVSGSGGHRS